MKKQKKHPQQKLPKIILLPPDGQFVREHSQIHRFMLISDYQRFHLHAPELQGTIRTKGIFIIIHKNKNKYELLIFIMIIYCISYFTIQIFHCNLHCGKCVAHPVRLIQTCLRPHFISLRDSFLYYTIKQGFRPLRD